MAAADIRARSVATAANLALRAKPVLTIAPAGAAGNSSGLWCHIARRDTDDLHLVVDARVKRGTEQVLLALNDDTPRWYSAAEIDRWEVKAS